MSDYPQKALYVEHVSLVNVDVHKLKDFFCASLHAFAGSTPNFELFLDKE